MKRHPPRFDWQPIKTLPPERVVEVMLRGGATLLAAKVSVRFVVIGREMSAEVIASVPAGRQVQDAIAWRDCPGADPLPPAATEIPDIEEKIAA